MPTTTTSRTASELDTNVLRSQKPPHPDEIAARAYELFENRGAVHDHDLEDWFEAELQFIQEREARLNQVWVLVR